MKTTELFQNKYRIKSTRLKDYDYSSDGYYFVTICVYGRAYDFGNIINNQMKLSGLGEIVKQEWLKTFKIRDNVLLGEYVIMPNHMHAIVIIQNNDNDVETRRVIDDVETRRGASLQSRFGPLKPKSLPLIVNQFKGSVKRWANKNEYDFFEWQSRFYDHIIRNNKSLNRIRQYIINNPINWERDRNNPENLYM